VRLLVSTKRELKMRGYREMELTYVGLGRILLGRLGFSVILATVSLAQFGVCIAYVIFVSATFHEFYSGIPAWGYALMMLVIQSGLCQIRNIKNLQYTSMMGNVLVFLIVISIYSFNLHMLGTTGNKASKAWDWNIRHFPRCIGIVTFAMEGITVVLPLESAMKEPKFFMTVVDAVMVGLCILLLTFGEVGYMVYGDETEDMITNNLPRNVFTNVVMATVTCNLIFTFPVQMFPVTEILDKEMDLLSNELYRTLIRILCVAFSVAVGISLPDFGAVLGVMGGVCFCSLGFLFPVLFYLILFEETLTTTKFWLLIILAVIGSIISMLVTVNSVIDLVYGK